MLQAENTLRQEDPPCAGKAYNIVDGGQPVEAFGFWYPLMEGVGATPPMIKVGWTLQAGDHPEL